MPGNMKPVHWAEIKNLFEGGQSANSIAKQMTERGDKISKQAILKRAKKEGWTTDPSKRLVQDLANKWQPVTLTQSDTGNRLATGPNRSNTQIAKLGKRTPENAAKILANIQAFGNEKLAAQAVGIHPDTLKRWKKDDEQFAGQIDAANALFCTDHVNGVVEASKRGDWKAAHQLLAVNPMTKDEWGHQAGVAGAGGGVTFNLKFELKRGEVPQEGDIIDITPES